MYILEQVPKRDLSFFITTEEKRPKSNSAKNFIDNIFLILI